MDNRRATGKSDRMSNRPRQGDTNSIISSKKPKLKGGKGIPFIKTSEPKIPAVTTTSRRKPPLSLGGVPNIVSKFRLQSLSHTIGQQSGQFDSRDPLMFLTNYLFETIFAFGGSGILYGLEQHQSEAFNETMPCNYTDIVEMSSCNASSLCGTPTAENCSSFLECANGSGEIIHQFHECLAGAPAVLTPTTFSMSIVFVLTVITTIGYGHIVTTSWSGRVVTIVYSVIVIPLFFGYLNDLAACIRDLLVNSYERLTKRGGNKSTETPMCPDAVPFSILFAVFLLYLFVTAGVFMSFNEFEDYSEALYFLLISATMVGFGDVLPSEEFQLTVMAFVLLGTILVSLCSMVQEEWTRLWLERLVDFVTAKPRQHFAEQTLEALMALPSEAGPPSALSGEGEAVKPYAVLAPLQHESAAPSSLHVRRQFNVGRLSVKEHFDEE